MRGQDGGWVWRRMYEVRRFFSTIGEAWAKKKALKWELSFAGDKVARNLQAADMAYVEIVERKGKM
jgi:hypothetical protein